MVEGQVIKRRVTKTGAVVDRVVQKVYGPSIREIMGEADTVATLDEMYAESMHMDLSPSTRKKVRSTYLARRDVLKVRLISGIR